MSDIIRLLPDSVANQIAAGEVIQRPASVIKELVENAVDAGASDIKIIIKDAGKTLIQVIDNGIGMSETDVRMAFERHATSKIRNADDLFSLSTMGFRGEALPSICAISEVEVKTRPEGEQMGTRLVILGSKVTVQEPCVCDKGTSISVRKIFFNVPARRKFLKSDTVELSNIMREFERLALVNNNIRMHIDTGVRNLDLRTASLRIRIEDIWKNTLKSDHLIPVEVDTSLVRIEGFISRPEFARRRNPLQYLIVNGRNMRHPYFHKAIMSCYDSLIASDTMPCYFIKFSVDPSTIDVNIHPTKNEIKFEYEQQIWPILVSAIKAALGKFSAVPSIDFSVDAIPLHPMREGDSAPAPHIEYRNDYNPFASAARATRQRVGSDWERLYDNFSGHSRNTESAASPHLPDVTTEASSAVSPDTEEDIFALAGDHDADTPQVCIQYASKYIVTTTRDGLVVIDQHRAHVRILYEEYLARVERMEVVSQSVMFPETVSLDASQQASLGGITEELHRLGFSLEYDSDTTWRITAVPALPKGTRAGDVIMRILDSIAEDSANYGKEGNVGDAIAGRVALVMARAAAIRGGQRLSVTEMEGIVSSLFALPDPSVTPDGNKVYTILDESRVARLLT
ncbi:MAG: DNA mismatch repair endonuclease MutL [Muribaculaceae bacterium]|nr:DNA mismatch repair endonuclease MutL [Muribaculaceae bacterium]